MLGTVVLLGGVSLLHAATIETRLDISSLQVAKQSDIAVTVYATSASEVNALDIQIAYPRGLLALSSVDQTKSIVASTVSFIRS